MEIARYFEMGGFAMYPIALLGCMGLPATLAGIIVAIAVKKPPRLALIIATVLCALGLLTAALGLLGYLNGLWSMEEAIAHVNLEDKEVIRWAATSEARVALMFGLIAGLPPFVGGVALLGLGLSRRLGSDQPGAPAA